MEVTAKIRTAAGLTCLLALALAAALLSANPSPALARESASPCPEVSALQRPERPRGAVPAAKTALGGDGRVLEVRRGPGSTYAAAVKRECGPQVLRDSVYVVVHPVGMTCAACDLHAYVVKLRDGPWKVWTAY
jgi:hypothetical protein